MSTKPQDWNKMTVVQLKAELTKRGLVTTGKKADLVERLQADTQVETATEAVEEPAAEVEEGGQQEPEQAAESMETETTEEVTPQTKVSEEVKEEDKTDEAQNGDTETPQEAAEGTEEESKEKVDEEKEEEKKEESSEKLNFQIPTRNSMLKAVETAKRLCTVMVGPLYPEDLINPELVELLNKASVYMIRAHNIGGKMTSIADIRYTNVQETKENEAALAEVKYVSDDIQIKRLTEIEKTAGCFLHQIVFKPVDYVKPTFAHNVAASIEDEKSHVAFRTVYVHNLPDDVSEADVREIYKDYADGIQQICVPVNEEGKTKGCAYVTFKSDEEAKTAQKATWKAIFKDRMLVVVHVKKQDYHMMPGKRPGGFGGPPGFGGPGFRPQGYGGDYGYGPPNKRARGAYGGSNRGNFRGRGGRY